MNDGGDLSPEASRITSLSLFNCFDLPAKSYITKLGARNDPVQGSMGGLIMGTEVLRDEVKSKYRDVASNPKTGTKNAAQ
jgi:hypothetical protein